MADIINLFGEKVNESVAEAKRTIGSRFVEKAGAEEDEEYNAFTEKFKPKKTTDDCYTPAPVYEAVKSWAVKEYGLEGRPILRPFFPGKDYQRETYPADCVVIDNPPFSILSEIVRFYMVKGVDFFLFAPTLTLYCVARGICNYLPTGKSITYENGAEVATSFVTNMGEYKIDANADLAKALADANEAAKPPRKCKPRCLCLMRSTPPHGAMLSQCLGRRSAQSLKRSHSLQNSMTWQRMGGASSVAAL